MVHADCEEFSTSFELLLVFLLRHQDHMTTTQDTVVGKHVNLLEVSLCLRHSSLHLHAPPYQHTQHVTSLPGQCYNSRPVDFDSRIRSSTQYTVVSSW